MLEGLPMRRHLSAILALAMMATAGHAIAADRATAQMRDGAGNDLGTVELRQVPHGVLMHMRMKALPPGVHGFHLHTVGKCEAPFESAGAHFNPTRTSHGLQTASGGHAGDLPNLHVPTSGQVDIEALASGVTLSDASLLDADGTALVVHAEPDDYATDPAGNSGARIACGVITP
jgi:Cu-Zn family superoxide dismutase